MIVSCAAKVFLVHDVKLVASKLPEKKIAMCDKALRIALASHVTRCLHLRLFGYYVLLDICRQ